NISEDISITLDNNDTIDWGTGYVNTSNPACSSNATLTTGDNAAPGVATDSAGNDCWTGIDTNEDFVVRSLANVPITVTINASKNATEFLGPVAEFQYQTYNHTNGCAAGTSVSYVNAWQDFNETEQEICGAGENMTNAGNRVGITVRILVPVSITGAKNVSVTFTSQKA
ncbi:hypothetical protein GOV05_05375, partial [Candidatus Woesearchaeota archaeon]|nr:hypothetical protein [Candidatus Woesearchaeota archaeon]